MGETKRDKVRERDKETKGKTQREIIPKMSNDLLALVSWAIRCLVQIHQREGRGRREGREGGREERGEGGGKRKGGERGGREEREGREGGREG